MNKAIDTVLAFAERNDIVPITLIKSCLKTFIVGQIFSDTIILYHLTAVISIEFNVKFSNTHHGYF